MANKTAKQLQAEIDLDKKLDGVKVYVKDDCEKSYSQKWVEKFFVWFFVTVGTVLLGWVIELIIRKLS